MPGPTTRNVSQGPPPPPEGRDWGGDGPSEGPGASRQTSMLLLYLLLISSTIVFLTLTTAFLARRSMGTDWVSTPKPPILWLSTGVLIVSSLVLETARRRLRSGQRSAFNRWWSAATALGILFLICQAMAWQRLWQTGFYIAANPSTSFFYVLTATHAAHVLGAVTAVVYVEVQAVRFRLGPAKRTAIDMSAIFWHFLDALWLCLMALFYLWG
ncbi:MAG: heme-copper oxidase subunit III [Acidobacteriia bacterium]|nr:heme-copper oxidase subunit III [Terriglobia bacterium]